jgi:hypothetical protein
MIAICKNCGGEVSTSIENARVDYCYRANCAYEGEE